MSPVALVLISALLSQVPLQNYRLDLVPTRHTVCASSDLSWYSDVVDITEQLTNLSDAWMHFFEGDSNGQIVFSDMNGFRAGTPVLDGTQSFYPEGVPEGRRYSLGPHQKMERPTRIELIVSKSGDDRRVLSAGTRVLMLEVRRRRLTDGDVAIRTGETREWVLLRSQPVTIVIPPYTGEPACADPFAP